MGTDLSRDLAACVEALELLETCYGVLPAERGPAGKVVRDYIAELQARCERAERDARRYRWLRGSGVISWNGYIEYQMLVASDAEREELDRNIDRNIAEEAAIDASREVGNG